MRLTLRALPRALLFSPQGHYDRQRGPRAPVEQKVENTMTTFDEKMERLKTLKECLKDQDLGMLLEPLLTTADLERLLRVDRRTITRLVKRGELPAPLKLGGSNRWRPQDIKAVIDRLGQRAGREIEPVASDGQ
jgi:predicted DNA-binding transcriptional regulator AlpA